MKDPILILIVILVVVIIWRGPKTLPQIGHMLGRGVKEARREAAEIKDDMHKDEPPAVVAAAPVVHAAPPAPVVAPPVAPAPPVAAAPPAAAPPSGTPGPGASGPA